MPKSCRYAHFFVHPQSTRHSRCVSKYTTIPSAWWWLNVKSLLVCRRRDVSVRSIATIKSKHTQTQIHQRTHTREFGKETKYDIGPSKYVYMQPNDEEIYAHETPKEETPRRRRIRGKKKRRRRREEKEPWKWKAILPSFPRFCTLHLCLCAAVVLLFIHLIYEYYDHTRISLVSFCFLCAVFSCILFFVFFFFHYFCCCCCCFCLWFASFGPLCGFVDTHKTISTHILRYFTFSMRFVYKLCVYMVQVCITKWLLLVGWKSIKEVYNSPNSQKIMTQRSNKTHSVPFLYNCTLCCWCFSKIVSFLPLASSFIFILFLQMLLHLNDAWILS